MSEWHGALGLLALPFLAWLCSEDRRQFPLRSAIVALVLQIVLAWLLLNLAPVRAAFVFLNDGVEALQGATRAGTALVFGYLGGGPLPFEPPYPGAEFILAFQGLPLVLLVSALAALLWHWRVLPLLVKGFSWLLEKSFRLSGAVGLASAANIFVGMVEAPLLIRPLLNKMSRADLFVLMTTGMATIAGTVLVLYATILQGAINQPVAHILTASVISVPAAILMARILVPESTEPSSETIDGLPPSPYGGSMEAIARGTEDGLKLLLSIVAMLVVLVAIVALINAALGLLPLWNDQAITLERILGLLLQPYAWLLGIPWEETATAGALIGKKTVLNEFIAYLDFAALAPEALSEKSRLILLYALCGFANPGSLGIMIGGLTAIAPERRAEFLALGPRSILAGTLATGMTGAVVGLMP